MKKKLVIGAVVVAALGTSAFMFSGDSAVAAASGGTTGVALFTVKRDDLNISLTEDGTLVAKESKKLSFKIKRSGRITFLVPEGKMVEEGEVVCKLDPENVQKQLEETELSLLSAQTTLNTARTNLEIQLAENVANVEKAANTKLKSEKDLERYRDGDAPQELRKLQVSLKDAETTYVRAEKKYKDSLELIKLKYIRQTEVEDHEIEFDKAKFNKESAELAIFLFNKYTKPMTMADKETALRDAIRALSTTEKKCESQLEQKKVAVTQAEKRVKRYERQIKELKEDIENMNLKAPVPGVVIYGDPRNPWNTENVKIGGNMWSGFTVMTIPDLRVMLVKLEVHEADINKVKEGQKATVTFDTYPGEVFEAEVSKIAQIAGGGGSPWQRASAVKKFDVEVTLKSEPETKLKPGISAKVEIFIDKLEETLFVPVQCVFLEEGKHYCNVQRDTGIVRKELKVGLSNESYTAILEGLDEGDQVLLYNPNLPAATEKSDEEDDKGKEAPKKEATPSPVSATSGSKG